MTFKPEAGDRPERPFGLQFQLGKVNVISGASRTGKSAVIPIIDYCLGAGTCSIPVKTIRKYCEWFGVVVATAQGDKLLARREPGAQRSTDDMYLLEAERITDIPHRIAKNINADAVKRLLDELAGLSKLDFSGGGESTGFDDRPSFRDLAAFTFQPQNVVANPDVLCVGVDQYQAALALQRGRLQLSSWLVSHTDDEADCPMCGSHTDSARRKLAVLSERLQEVEAEAGVDKELPAAFDRELQRVNAEVGQMTERLRSVQIRKRALSGRSDEARQRQFAAQRAERFVGNLESALDLHRRLGSDSELVEEVMRLRELVQRLEAELHEQNVEARKRRALHAINNSAGRILPHLDVESPNDPISLEINDLTIKVRGPERDDYLSEIGSGSNWLSYRLAVLLALHQFFLSQHRGPVPAFLVLDQPSQVYFPKRIVARPEDDEDEEVEDPQLRDEDVDAVRQAFEVMGRVALDAKGGLQLIVLDHASRDVWGDIEGVVGLPEWRNGVKLVPLAWLDEV